MEPHDVCEPMELGGLAVPDDHAQLFVETRRQFVNAELDRAMANPYSSASAACKYCPLAR